MRLTRPSLRTPIAIDLGSRVVKLAQARMRGGKARQLMLAAMELTADEPPAEAAGKIAGLLRRRGFEGRDVVLAIPPDLLQMETLELPKVAAAAVDQLAEMEIGRVTRLKARTFEHGVWELPAPARGGSGVHVLAVALAHSEADNLCEPFLEAGLDVVGMLPQVAALAALTRTILPLDDQLQTIIDIGGAASRVIILQQGAVLFHRTIHNVGGGALEQTLRTELGVSEEIARHIVCNVGMTARNLEGLAPVASRIRRVFETTIEAIISELQLTQNYITHRYQQQTAPGLMLAGGGAAIPGFADALAVAAGRSSMILSPGLFTAPGAGSDGGAAESPRYIAALASALYAMEETP